MVKREVFERIKAGKKTIDWEKRAHVAFALNFADICPLSFGGSAFVKS